MVKLFVAGNPVGTLADAERVFAEAIAKRLPVEFCDETGAVIGSFVPAEPLVPWDATVTRAELDRRAAEPGLSIDELRERLGWA